MDEDCGDVIDHGTEGYDDGYTEFDGDCNDGDASVYPGATEDYANGVDHDCDGGVNSSLADFDFDGDGDGDGDGVAE